MYKRQKEYRKRLEDKRNILPYAVFLDVHKVEHELVLRRSVVFAGDLC